MSLTLRMTIIGGLVVLAFGGATLLGFGLPKFSWWFYGIAGWYVCLIVATFWDMMKGNYDEG